MVLTNDWRQVGNNGGGGGMRAVGCIKSTKGPWVVHRKTKDGGVKKTLRFPSDRERVENKERERRRRAVSSKIFAGLRAHGNYQLSTKSDSNDVLKAVCEEAGWIVADDGTVLGRRPKTPGVELGLAAKAGLEENQEGYRTCPCNGGNLQASNEIGGSETLRMVPHFDESDLTLSLSLPIRPASNPLGFNRSLRMMPHFDESGLTLSLPIRPASNLLGFDRTFMQR